MFTYRDNSTEKPKGNQESLGNVESAAADVSWQTGAEEWLSVSKLFADKDVTQLQSKPAFVSIREAGVNRRLALTMRVDLYSLAPEDINITRDVVKRRSYWTIRVEK